MMLAYHSTNRALDGGFRGVVSFEEALFCGMAPDGGLFMPVTIPSLTQDELRAFEGAPYHDVAAGVLRKFLVPELDASLVDEVARDAFDFDVPVERIDDDTYLLRLDRGPSASFKDFGARFMARMMSELRPTGGRLTVLVATSGDTGAAVGEAFRGSVGTDVYILYPAGEVSEVQRRSLDGIGENVRTLAVDGKFDDCQALVKRAFADADLSRLNLTSANSINVGRVLPQVAYYVYTGAALAQNKHLVFSIPSGNLGNSLGCELARRMGLPVGRIVIAANENDAFPRFLETGIYETVDPSIDCLSNAMNVGNPSNLARYFDLYGGTLTRDGVVHKMPDVKRMRENLYGVSVGDADTLETIRLAYRRYGVVVEPHGAVAVEALWRYRAEHPGSPAVCVETAHPAKFPDVIERQVGFAPAPTAGLERISRRLGRAVQIENSFDAFKECLLKG